MTQRNWLSFSEARLLVRDECVESVADYLRWHDWNKPRQIPKYPANVFIKEWISWNDWLGNDNVFDKNRRTIRPFAEAVAWVHKLNLTASIQWVEYVREHGIPKDIPSHPELYYPQWVSWTHWIGRTASLRVAVAQTSIEECGILYIVHMPSRPPNIFKIGIESGGVSAIRDSQAKMGFRVIKMYKMEKGYDWKQVVDHYAKPWWENDAEYIVANVNELMFDLGSDLLFA